MQRKLLAALGVSIALGISPAVAQTTLQDQYIAMLTEQGFTELEISRTWLGRTRIEAKSKTSEREIIFNSRTGEILRDFTESSAGDGSSSGDNASGNSESGSGADGGETGGSAGDSGGTGGDGGSGGDGGDPGGSSGGDSGGDAGGSGGGSGAGGQAALEIDFDYLTGGKGHDIMFG